MNAARLRRALLVGFTLLSSHSGAFPSAHLSYERDAEAESCPDEAGLRRAVLERLGYDPFFKSADRSIVARITTEPGELRGEVELLDENGIIRGHRELRAPRAQCAELVSRMALAISIAVDPASVGRVVRRQGDGAPASATPKADDTSTGAMPKAEQPQEPLSKISAPRESTAPGRIPGAEPPLGHSIPLKIEWSLGALASTGLAPELGGGPVVSAGLHRSWWSTAVEARYQLVHELAAESGHVASSLSEAALLGCARPRMMLLCAELSVGRLSVEGAKVTRPASDSTWVSRIGTRAGVDLTLSESLSVRIQAGALLGLSRPRVLLDGKTVWEAPALGGFSSLSLVGRFP